MLTPQFFYEQLRQYGVEFYTGVPDSLLKNFCAYVTDVSSKNNHIIAVNEGTATGLACGYHLATGKIPLVYMQNSGLGNATNPLLSLADKKVYSIPLLLLIGWRGEPETKDEPQHISQGEVTLSMLEAMNIPYSVLNKDENIASAQLKNIFEHISQKNEPYAIVVQKETFAPYSLNNITADISELSREDAIAEVIKHIDKNDIVVSTTGMISRELYELREQNRQAHSQDFLTVGSMGHASQIALGIALNKPDKKVYCLDGDGAALMHLGGLATVADCAPKNYIHIIFNNAAHDSVGGQPTIANSINLQELSKAFGYSITGKAANIDEIKNFFNILENKNISPALLEICVKKGSRKDLGRPKSTPVANKIDFMNFILKNI